MAFAPVPGYSRTSIDRAGERLRDLWQTGRPINDEDIEAYAALVAFRLSFQVPLSKTAMGLRSMVCSEWPELKAAGVRVPVVQRMKRRVQIINKLERMPESKLSNMGDIGGCRAVVETRDQVDGVMRRIRKNWKIQGQPRDTRDDAGPSGYRAINVIIERDGRRVEIQLRTPREHEWAVAVERTGARLGIPLKEGLGPRDLKEFFRLASEGMYREELGQSPTTEFLERFRVARQAVNRYLEVGTGD